MTKITMQGTIQDRKETMKNHLANKTVNKGSENSLKQELIMMDKLIFGREYIENKEYEAIFLVTNAKTKFFLIRKIFEGEYTPSKNLFEIYYQNELGFNKFIDSYSFAPKTDYKSQLSIAAKGMNRYVSIFNTGYELGK